MDTSVPIVRWSGDSSEARLDTVVLEAPLEIRANGVSLAITMRTPGADFGLALGFLFTEGVISSADEVESIGYGCTEDVTQETNVIAVTLASETAERLSGARLQRNLLATSSCGICGKAGLEGIACLAKPLPPDSLHVRARVLRGLNDTLRRAQKTFDRTGGLHAAGLFDDEGALLWAREDVGRHNAVDKLIGKAIQERILPLDRRILFVSGRVSFEIVQKAAMARVPVLCAVSAPSSLAVSLAEDLNITLIGFLRGDTMNVYTGSGRVIA